MKRNSKCRACPFTKDCGGFRDREGRCPEWAAKDERCLYFRPTLEQAMALGAPDMRR